MAAALGAAAAARGAHLNATIFRQVACKSVKIHRYIDLSRYLELLTHPITLLLHMALLHMCSLSALLTEQRFGPKCFAFTDA